MSSPNHGPATLLADVHVHFYPSYDRHRFFNRAMANFDAASKELRLDAPWAGCLVMTEATGHHAFEAWRTEAEANDVTVPAAAPKRDRFVLSTRDEDRSLTARLDERPEALYLIGGRQIQTREGLEVLAFPIGDVIPDGLPTAVVLETVEDAGAVSVIPWGFGKWWLGRGRYLYRLIRARNRPPLLLADTAHRPRLGPQPRVFIEAEERSIPVLAGSDPLPLRAEDGRAGSFGFALAGPVDGSAPAAALAIRLSALRESPPTYGTRPGLPRFVRTQVAMQVKKRLGRVSR